MTNWKDIGYLQTGTPRQQLAYVTLQNLGVLATLRDFDPVLAGTIPLDIDIASSDLDVLCAVAPAEVSSFTELLRSHYAHLPEFALAQKIINHRTSVVCCFRYQEFEVEIFGQDCPTEVQHAFRHMIVEDVVLQAGGEAWRTAVRQLKEKGLKTEPAFATLLQLRGNPYEAILSLEGKSIEEIRMWMANLPALPDVG
ncbi:alpha/beta hydrolase [Hymenobacter qilianensis]|uniref:Alpha/beta hydrolase n=2 Tax=Hymenobacter qilianensis TaxID=1385715 RepID=A0ACB5PPA5_9BACT|nr:DUF4269 domain-containing protein [Hymenobacter qilianensis]QNP53234.1 DUF4269 domain-containing protein [Hymenobacter qilianensis]GGF58462.1 alpha/beta hydrolase [Hymenobacter qilianensis]